MAVMIPDDVQDFCTEGERHFYGFLKLPLNPTANIWPGTCRTSMAVNPISSCSAKTPDSSFLKSKTGAPSNPGSKSPEFSILTINGRNEERESPLKQARTYCHILMDKIRDDRRLLSKDPQHATNPKIPIHEGVVFPNINKYEYIQKAFDKVIHSEQIFFWDDLHPESDICRDLSGQCFSTVLQKKYAAPFHFNLDTG